MNQASRTPEPNRTQAPSISSRVLSESLAVRSILDNFKLSTHKTYMERSKICELPIMYHSLLTDPRYKNEKKALR